MKCFIQRRLPVPFHRNRLTIAAPMLATAWVMQIASPPLSAHESVVPHLHSHAAEQTPESGLLMVALAAPLIVLAWALIRRLNRRLEPLT